MDRHSPKTRTRISHLAESFDSVLAADASADLLFGGGRNATRADLHELTSALEHELDGQLGDQIGAGALIAVAAVNGIGFLAAVLALWRRSAVPLLLDCDSPLRPRMDLATRLGARGVVECATPWPNGTDDFRFTASGREHRRQTLGHETAVVKLTSGSTGSPRGISVPAAAVLADSVAIERAMGIDDADRLVAAVPMSYSYGFGSLAVPSLLFGRQLVIPAPGEPLANLAAARRHAATVLPTVPVFLSALIKRDTDWQLPESLRLIVSAGAPLSTDDAAAFRRRFGQPVHVFYGASECGGICYDRIGDAAERGTVGTAISGVEITVHDDTGLVEVRSESVATSYLPPEPDVLGDGRFRCNDQARWDNGELRLLGRSDNVINLGGHKVNPEEVQQILLAMPGVVDALVVAVPRASKGQASCCAIIASPSGSLSRKQVLDWCATRLSPAKLPRQILVVQEIPRTSRGKLDTQAIRRLASENAQASA